MGLIRDINSLNPEMKKRVDIFLQKLKEKNIQYFINETLRTLDVQKAYFAQGREPLLIVNKLRENADLWKIKENENKIVTWTLKSKHLEGRAIDIVPIKEGKLWWNAPEEVWKSIAECAKEADLSSGYYWKHRDCPHHEI